MDYNKLCLNVCELAREVGSYAKKERMKFSGLTIETKGKNDFVTHVDKESERMIIESLKKMLPQSGFIAEEQTSSTVDEKYNWIIDPIDGTTNFIHGLPPHAISIALKEYDEIVIGVVYEIALEECFYAWKGDDAFLNGNKIRVSSTQKVNNCLIATGFPYNDYSRMEEFIDTMRYFFQNSHGLRRIGSAATDLVYVACGRFDAFYEYSLKPWDVAAGAFIVEQAGGKITDFSGGNNYLFGKEIIASNAMVTEEITGIISKKMVK